MVLSGDLIDSTRTVLHIAAHFERLKDQADSLMSQLDASSRGFFTPTEDEQVRQLLVSYWHSRNALFELVMENRDYDESVSLQERHLRFLLAFSGALVLIDAARFLRDRIHDRPVVRAKLNEPEPGFNIPGGVYDAIQKSLTSPTHAWHLYHALQYLESEGPRLRATAESAPETAKLFELITALRNRLEVRLEKLIRARFRARVTQITTGLRRDLLFRVMYGLQKMVSQLMSERYVQLGHRPALPADIADTLRGELQPGDVLITRKEFALTNYFLPGYWPHAALYLGVESDLEQLDLTNHFDCQLWLSTFRECGPTTLGRVLEALKDGVRLRGVSTPLSCDAIAVVRPNLTSREIGNALARGFRYVGRPYDFDFDFSRSERLVCTEVVYRSYEGLGGLAFPLIRRAGRLTLSAEDLLQMALRQQGFQVIGAYAPNRVTEFQSGVNAVRMLRATLER